MEFTQKRPSVLDDVTKKNNLLHKLNIFSDADLLFHLPIRYEDETTLHEIHTLEIGQIAQIEGVVVEQKVVYRLKRQLWVMLKDTENHSFCLRFLHFYPSQLKQMAVGQCLRARGEVRKGALTLEMVHPQVRAVDEKTPLPETLTPIYRTKAGISQAYLRKRIARALSDSVIQEYLPAEAMCFILKDAALPGLAYALQTLHFPNKAESLQQLSDRTHPAWMRVKFEELLTQHLLLKRAQAKRRALRSYPVQGLVYPTRLQRQLLEALTFSLTEAQQRVLLELMADLANPFPMMRLLQGDVGSGKTIVAALVALAVIEAGLQVAVLAPTELLAEQHVEKFKTWFADMQIHVGWLNGSLKAKQKREIIESVSLGKIPILIGTHAIIQQEVQFNRLGLIIIDEQHRFGVEQRLALQEKGRFVAENDLQFEPNQLMMSATPIPRTLAMTYYADLDVSTIDALPPNRVPVLTRLISASRRDEVIERVRHAALQGRQVYWVCPLIEESEALQLQTAQETFDALNEVLPELKIGLLHGRLSAVQKTEVMRAFLNKSLHLLVATTVIEVGVDVPNASLMIIENAERFGLAQLHQLRGRVGRGEVASVCILMYGEALSQTGKARLFAMREIQDGFEISRQDLQIRGPGDFLGARQSGEMTLRFVSMEQDERLVELVGQVAQLLLDRYPDVVDAYLLSTLARCDYFLTV